MDDVLRHILDTAGNSTVFRNRRIQQSEQRKAGLNGHRTKQTEQDDRPQGVGNNLRCLFEHQAEQQHENNGHTCRQAHVQELRDKGIEIHTVTS